MTNPSDAFLDSIYGKKKKDEEETEVTQVSPEATVAEAPEVPKPEAPQENIHSQEFLSSTEQQIDNAVKDVEITKKETTWGEDLDNAISDVQSAWDTSKGFVGYLPEHFAERSISDIDKDVLRGVGTVAHAIDKGLIGLADLALVPVSALTIGLAEASDYVFGTEIAPGTSMTMLSDKFQKYFPDDEILPAEQEGIFDDLVRIAHTSLEMGTGVGLQKGVNLVTKTADDAALLSKETAMGLGAGAAYQVAKENGATEGQAMFWMLAAPMSPSLIKAAMDPKKLAKDIGGVVKTTAVAASEAFVIRSILAPVKKWSAGYVTALKTDLQGDPTMWSETAYWRLARKAVLSIKDKPESWDKRIQNLERFQDSVHKAIPQNEAMRRHDTKMTKASDLINDFLEETIGKRSFKLTLEQRFGPELKRIQHEDGVANITDAYRIIYGNEYNAQLQANREAIYEYLKSNTKALHGDGPDAEALGVLFNDYTVRIDELQGTIESLAITGKSVDGITSERELLAQMDRVEHAYPQDAVNASLRPAVIKTNKLVKEAYQLTLDSLPKHIEIDSTPLATAITRVFKDTGAFADPTKMPTYVRTLVNGLKSISKTAAEKAPLSRKLLDESDRLAIVKTEIIQQKTARKAEWVVAKEALDVDAETYKADLKKIDDQYTADKVVLDKEASDTAIAIKENALAKRGQVKEVTPEAETLADLEPPTLATVGEVAEAVTLVNKMSRAMYRGQKFEEYDILTRIRAGLDATMEGLADQDPAAYKRWVDGNAHYSRFIAKDINDSMAGKIVKDGDHYPELTGDQVFRDLFEQADDDTLTHFLHAFKGDRAELAPFLKQLEGQTVSEFGPRLPRKPVEEFGEYSQEAIGALKDMVYSTLVRKINDIDVGPVVDPVVRMQTEQAVIGEFIKKHGSKLRLIPGFESMQKNAKLMSDNIGQYIDLHQRATQAKTLALVKNAVGPNATIQNIVRNEDIAMDVRNFLDNMHEVMETTGNLMAEKHPQIMNLKGSHSAKVSRKVRTALFDAYLDEYTQGAHIDYEGMLADLHKKGGSRRNLVTVLGEKEVVKLEGIANIAQAIDSAKMSFTDSLSSSSIVRIMEESGLPLGRVASRLQQRAVFRPSVGFMAGSAATIFLNKLAQADTARTLKILMDDPAKLSEIDNIIGAAVQSLKIEQRNAIQAEMRDPYGNMANIMNSTMTPIVKALYRYANHNGYKIPEDDIKEALVEELYNKDPRSDKAAAELPVLPEVTPAIPEVTPEEPEIPVAEPEVTPEEPEIPEATTQPAPVTNVPEITPSDPTSALATRKSMKEIRGDDDED